MHSDRDVSEFWASILRGADFTELFLTKSLTRPRILFSFTKLFVFSTPQPQNLHENSSVVATRYKSFPNYLPTGISSALCGLVFLHGWRGNGVICNPVTGESITLPRVQEMRSNTSYFGYDPINKQFKVLCITWSKGRPNTHRVWTLETGKRLWRTIQDPIFPHTPLYGEIYINGVLYYKAYFEENFMIVCFDVKSEKFGVINKDKDMLHVDHWTLVNYKGKLGAILRSRREKALVLWVLEDAGEHKWSKTICIVPPLLCNAIGLSYIIVGMTSTGEIVSSPYTLSNAFYLYYYNVERMTFTRVDIKGFEEFKHHRGVRIFLDSVENIKLM